MPRSCSVERAGSARISSPTPSTPPHGVATARSSRSTARRFPASFWSRSCSATRRARSLERTRKPGQFEYANKGTIYLDEIAELPLALQAKLLHVLQDFRFSRVGGQGSIDLD